MCEMVWGAFFDKNSFILETKLNVLKNIFLKVERKVSFPWEHPYLNISGQHLLKNNGSVASRRIKAEKK